VEEKIGIYARPVVKQRMQTLHLGKMVVERVLQVCIVLMSVELQVIIIILVENVMQKCI
jgi:hypothetical protein